jgi:hypothetical protein
MLEFFKTLNKVFRIVFIGFVVLAAIVKAFDIKSDKDNVTELDEADYATSEFDEIW